MLFVFALTYAKNNALIEKKEKHWWSKGRMLACHAGDPSSSLGQCKSFLKLILFLFFCFCFLWSLEHVCVRALIVAPAPFLWLFCCYHCSYSCFDMLFKVRILNSVYALKKKLLRVYRTNKSGKAKSSRQAKSSNKVVLNEVRQQQQQKKTHNGHFTSYMNSFFF